MALIFVSTYFFNFQNNKKLADSNLKMGLLLNKSIANNSDSILVTEYKACVINQTISQTDYNHHLYIC